MTDDDFTADQHGIRVLIVDDQRVVRDGLTMLLGLLDGVVVTGAAVDGEDAIAKVAADPPRVVLMDLNMPRMDGVEATRRLTAAYPEVRIVVLTTYAEDEWLFAALRAGARGFLTKDAGAEEIKRAVTAVARGQAQLDPDVQLRLLDALRSGAHVGVPAGGAPRQAAEPPDRLTPREAEVLGHIAAGRSNAEIARELYVSEATVKTHINHIFAKTGLRDRAQLVGYAFRAGLAEPGD